MILLAEIVMAGLLVQPVRKFLVNGYCRRGEGATRTTATIAAITENGDRSFLNGPDACHQFLLAEKQVPPRDLAWLVCRRLI